MAILRSFRYSPFINSEHAGVKKGEYVLLTVYKTAAYGATSIDNLKTWLNNHKEYVLFFESPEHFNNTHGGATLKTVILEKVA